MKIAVIGTGAYGLAIASAIAKNHHQVFMWSESEEKVKEWKKTNKIASISPTYEIPANIQISNDLESVIKDSTAIFIVTASKYFKKTIEDLKPFYSPNVPICIASKGLEEESGQLLSIVTKNILAASNIAVVSGPTFATDMLNNDPLALALGATNNATKKQIYEILRNDTLKLRLSNDIIGIQVCGSVKNIIAIASGILAGLGYVESTQAFLINESLHDIKSLIAAMGGKKKTILSFAGVGDLLMTSMSKKSRNYSFGYLIGSTDNHQEILDYLNTTTVEGYFTLKTVMKLLQKNHISLPIITLINDIVDGNVAPKELVTFLINKQ